MGEVYRARDTRLNRDVAIKILPDAFASDPDRIARFVREAQTLASLNHPHIAQIYGIEESSPAAGQAQGPTRALVMELVPGDTLADRIASGAISIDDALPIARQIVDALEAAHDAGIIHRDLKPANIKLRPDGTVKVLDFGLAKAFDQGSGVRGQGSGNYADSPTITSPAMTQAGVIMGTAAYMSPEQARGKAVDKRADIWAFGCVLYEMLTGRSPFQGETVTDVIAAVVKNDPDWSALPVSTPASVRRTLRRCLRKDPRERLRDIADARLDIVEADATESATTPTRTRLNPLWFAATALVALIAGGLLGMQWSRPPQTTVATRWTGVRLAAPSNVMSPVLSPDGQLIAFQTIVDGQSQVGVMSPTAGTWRVLTSDRTRGLMVVHDWSPDGSRIFFDRQTDTLNGIYWVPSLGGDERLVVDNAGYPSTLPNGDLLMGRVNAQRQTQLHRFYPSTGQVEALPAIIDYDESDDSVVASADGRRVYFFGQPLATATQPSTFFELDLETKQTAPLELNVSLRRPVALGLHRPTGDVLIGGLEGDSFTFVRWSAQRNVGPRALFSVPATARFDIDGRERVYFATRVRPPELFTFSQAGAAAARVDRTAIPSVVGTRTLQTFAPLPDGRVLIGSRTADRDQVVAITIGGTPSRLVDGDEQTRPPVTAVGKDRAAVMMGPRESPDIAVVNTADGRVVRRFKAPSATMTTMGAAPDGAVLYYTDGGSVWSMPAEGGTPAKLGAGDSLTVDPDTGDLIVKLDEGARMRLVRMKASGGEVQLIPLQGDLRLIPRPLVPGAVRQGRLVLGVASVDSWFWHAATVDLKTGVVTKLAEKNPSDFHFATWRADGAAIGFGYGLDTTLWRFTSQP